MIQERKKSTKHQKMGAGILMATVVIAVIAGIVLTRNPRKLK